MNNDIEVPETKQPAEIKAPKTPKKGLKWSEMSPATKTRLIVQVVIQCVLTAWTLWDLKNRPASQINGDKRWWVLGAFIQPFGPIAYLIFGRKRK